MPIGRRGLPGLATAAACFVVGARPAAAIDAATYRVDAERVRDAVERVHDAVERLKAGLTTRDEVLRLEKADLIVPPKKRAA